MDSEHLALDRRRRGGYVKESPVSVGCPGVHSSIRDGGRWTPLIGPRNRAPKPLGTSRLVKIWLDDTDDPPVYCVEDAP